MKLRGYNISDEDAPELFDNYIKNVAHLGSALDESAELLTEASKNIAKGKGLYRTGAGVAGLVWDKEEEYLRKIGWSPRPNLHLIFHEIGTYKDPPRPHLRPAVYRTEQQIIETLSKQILED